MDLTGVVFFSVLLGLGATALTIYGGYWLQRVAVRHGMRDHYEWVLRERALRAAYLAGDFDEDDDEDRPHGSATP